MAMVSIVIRARAGGGRGRACYFLSSLCKRSLSCNLFNKIDPIESSLSSISVRFLSSFSTNDFDDQNPSSSSSTTRFQSNGAPSPAPHPIPNRPLRAADDRRRPPPPTSPPRNPQFSRGSRDRNNPDKESGGVDFLERSKLGFEKNEKDSNDSELKSVAESKAGSGADSGAPVSPQNADEIFKDMKKKGMIPNAVAMLDGLCKDGLLQEAMKLFGVMREKGTIPEVVIYTGVVDGLCKAHKFDDAIRIFRKMQQNDIVPNAFSYRLLIQGLCEGKRLEDALEFSVEALEAGHPLNLATFMAIVKEFCQDRGLDEAKNVIGTLRQKGLVVDEKAVREYLEKKGPFSPVVWEAIIGKKASQRSHFFD